MTFNQLVAGSNPARPTIQISKSELSNWVVSSVGRAVDF
ncbi:protein of unknown function [Xenorhabdus nematophila AN6/1]|nr:hypothetical protein XNA1_4500045 [Xenorhabdus nematophila str. Anatoliense]CEF28574.1 hypothetical protein XNW1_1160004 [Xenorhabdus nematophila str. Websteri]CEF32401.1 hypothetical protein XNW1_4300004 [Xenorhabdus nematophila str. Websteri]CEK24077.1 protein of unknown function [Xenorhabdus nematophila AN6/1]